ncbi:hypothetical protein ACN1C3_30165 [Pseudomonas sp. H11T01]|uniref:hypothetical protein n=1 Tax=Pseudomonas sp. H11T01 TaxID=3402749 RepID=UPI003AD3EF53
MKAKLLVRKSTAHCVSSPTQLEQMLGSGDWLIAAPPARSKSAKNMRLTRERLRSAGWLQLDLWLPPDVIAMVKAAKLPGENYSELFIRLVKTLGISD